MLSTNTYVWQMSKILKMYNATYLSVLLFQQKVAKSSPNSFSEETPAYTTIQPTSLSLAEGHYSTLGQWISKDCIYTASLTWMG